MRSQIPKYLFKHKYFILIKYNTRYNKKTPQPLKRLINTDLQI
jgi:hypothetical protein